MPQRTVLITGANGGAGRAITRAFLDAGDTVAGVARKITKQDFDHPNFVPIPADLLDPNAAARAIETVHAIANRIDVLVHVMGGFEGGGPVWQTGDAAWERMLDVNFRSALRTIRAAVPRMLQSGKGRIIAIGSRQALEPAPTIGPYNVSKAALVSLIRTLCARTKSHGHHSQRNPSRHHRHAGQPRSHARCRSQPMGQTRIDREAGALFSR